MARLNRTKITQRIPKYLAPDEEVLWIGRLWDGGESLIVVTNQRVLWGEPIQERTNHDWLTTKWHKTNELDSALTNEVRGKLRQDEQLAWLAKSEPVGVATDLYAAVLGVMAVAFVVHSLNIVSPILCGFLFLTGIGIAGFFVQDRTFGIAATNKRLYRLVKPRKGEGIQINCLSTDRFANWQIPAEPNSHT